MMSREKRAASGTAPRPSFQCMIVLLLSVTAVLKQTHGFHVTRIRTLSSHEKVVSRKTGFSGTHVHAQNSDMARRSKYAPTTLNSAMDSTSSTSAARDQLLQRLVEWFQGDFDNYPQVVEDRLQGLVPREGGGHEHFHCTLVPLTSTSRLAAFFFDGNPERIFRFRHYQMLTKSDSDVDIDASKVVEMQLSTLHPDLEATLRANSKDPLSWPSLFQEFEPSDSANDKVSLLPKCEIEWSLEKDPEQHAYAMGIPHVPKDGVDAGSSSLHAVMVHGEAIVNSTIVPGMAIRILDQLSLYDDVFYINDRGFDPLTGAFIYGNQRGVPYRLDRVSHFVPLVSSATKTPPELQRQVDNPDLEWTLGPDCRTEDDYREKMDVIGGESAGINKKGYKSKMSKAMVDNKD